MYNALDVFICYSLHTVEELLTDKEEICGKAQQDNAGDTRVHS
jgi:hypothetical protein